MKTYENTFTKEQRLTFAATECIDGLEQTITQLPKPATDEEITQNIRKIKACIGTLMSDVRRIECELEGKPINLENMTVDFFERIAKVRREA